MRIHDFLSPAQLAQIRAELDAINFPPRKLDEKLGERVLGLEYDLGMYKRSQWLHEIVSAKMEQLVPDLVCENYWASFSKPGTSVLAHNHLDPGETPVEQVAIVYVNAEDSGVILLHELHRPLVPVSNDLLTFPGHITHSVSMNNSDVTRRCVTFDFIKKGPEGP